jgi:hypothetical protein
VLVRGIRTTHTRKTEMDTHTQTSLPAIGAILVAQRTDDLVVGIRLAKGALGARGGGGGAGRHFWC